MLKSLEGHLLRNGQRVREQVLFDDESGLIVDVGSKKIPGQKVDYAFGDDFLIFPAMGDVHVHAREDVSAKQTYKEDFISASKAAIGGGVAHFFDMPNNPVPPVDDQSYAQKFALTGKAPLPIGLYAGIGPETFPLALKVPYKVYMGPSVGDLYFRDLDQLGPVLERYRGCYVSFHCEDPLILDRCQGAPTHEERRPQVAEVSATAKALYLIEKYGLKGKLCHYSTGEGLAMVREARRRGVEVECEVTPQHLYFSTEDLQIFGPERRTFFQMNPPIRNSGEREALLSALLQGEVDYLATDHAPHSPEEKAKGTSGLTGLDTFGAFATWLLLEKRVPAAIVSKICSENPGRFFNMFLETMTSLNPSCSRFGKGMGFIERGFSASFTVLNLKAPVRITKDLLQTKAGDSPFLNVEFPGRVEGVFLQGKLITNR